jgi:energy-coupling factor transporter ATP-binding protein EcfA2
LFSFDEFQKKTAFRIIQFFSHFKNKSDNFNNHLKTVDMPNPRLILFAGHAGTGKTTLAKRAVPLLSHKFGHDFFFLDKDTAYGAFSSHIMGLLTGDPADRDSPTYLQHLRDQEYSGLLDITRENLEIGNHVILVGPFTREILAGKFFQPTELGMPANTECRVAWIDLSSEEAKRRIQARNDARDHWKLANWEAYMKRRVEPPSHPALMRMDNGSFDTAKFDALLAFLLG